MKKTISEYHRALRAAGVQARSRVVIAVSGGADSIALLRLFALVRAGSGSELCVAHLDHGLRRASAADARFVERAAAKQGIRFIGAKADVRREAARRKLSIEEAARECRYAFLASAAKKFRAGFIATAHTMDDQAETVLMRLLRGAGLRGLSGIPSERAASGIRLIRPLLGFRKSDLVKFLRADKASWREDASNASDDFLRNRVRRTLLPHLKKVYSPQFDAHLVRLSSIASDVQDFISKESASVFRKISKKSAGRLVVSVRSLSKLHPAIRSEVLFLAAESASGTRRQFKKTHLDSILALLEGENGAASSRTCKSLPHGLEVRLKGSGLHFIRGRRRGFRGS